MLAGFPCQPFSWAEDRKGFADTRGTLVFDIERILLCKRPKAFSLENVEGLMSHGEGGALKTIVSHLESIGYKVSYSVLNSRYFGVPQERRRIYIVGTFTTITKLDNSPIIEKNIGMYIGLWVTIYVIFQFIDLL